MEEIENELDKNEFEKLLEKSFHDKNFNDDKVHKGALIEGTVIKVTSEDAFLDLGLKTEGIINLQEFSNDKIPKVGDVVKAVVQSMSPSEIILSFSKAKNLNSIDQIESAYQNQLIVSAKIVKVINGGFLASIDNNISAFVPISQIDLLHISEEDQEKYVGKTFDFLVLQVSKGNQTNVVLSRRQLLQKQTVEKKEEFLRTKKEGDIVTGTVKNYASFGVFVDLGGFDGLLHVSDLSWGKHVKLSEVAPKDAELQMKITKIDPNNKKVNLSLKALQPNPWDHIHETYSQDQVVTGEVVKILPYGAFVHLDDSIEGFIHVSDMSWVQRVNHPKDILKIHSIVECKILAIDQEKQQISLGMKQIHENPWDKVHDTYPIGLKVSAKVVNVFPAGAVVELEEGLKGFIAKTNFVWTKQQEVTLTTGESIDCKILGYDDANREIKLGIKQLTETPWEKEGVKEGAVVEGVITNITDFGIFVRITEEIEGLIPKSQAYNPAEFSSYEQSLPTFKKDEKIQAIVQHLNPDTNKLTLSIRQIQEQVSKQELQKHLVEDDELHHSIKLGDILDSQ